MEPPWPQSPAVNVKPQPARPCTPNAPLSEHDLQQIYQTALKILSGLGMGEAPPALVEQALKKGANLNDAGRLCYPVAMCGCGRFWRSISWFTWGLRRIGRFTSGLISLTPDNLRFCTVYIFRFSPGWLAMYYSYLYSRTISELGSLSDSKA